MPPSTQPQPEDPFTTLLTLEDSLYTSAYSTGLAAGAKAGKIEGRVFGLEKGFEKFAALGVLHGRSVVWGARLPSPHNASKEKTEAEHGKGEVKGNDTRQENTRADAPSKGDSVESVLPLLPPLPRLPPHITLLHSLTDPPTFSTSNTEDAVADLDDRFKRGASKAKLIALLLKEPDSASTLASFATEGSPRRKMKVAGEGSGKKEDSMEDFGGARALR
ncbi:hypothetical protein K505DRAFT_316217 [Melanomma pulvis-pyrius CBS 109.77]|uniref:Essential protein Yae1 N-terminal domain-containing protein n=1 Tax=Melanomma pulvis-pyrius CBS 109.77 TaxID=1314802 RepID=A0A6A6WV11_9PLEO|nr:hypothetical protein K505DRAFT_316217 [Melanomma pulvis-pyrius CBS 109.77]